MDLRFPKAYDGWNTKFSETGGISGACCIRRVAWRRDLIVRWTVRKTRPYYIRCVAWPRELAMHSWTGRCSCHPRHISLL